MTMVVAQKVTTTILHVVTYTSLVLIAVTGCAEGTEHDYREGHIGPIIPQVRSPGRLVDGSWVVGPRPQGAAELGPPTTTGVAQLRSDAGDVRFFAGVVVSGCSGLDWEVINDQTRAGRVVLQLQEYQVEAGCDDRKRLALQIALPETTREVRFDDQVVQLP